MESPPLYAESSDLGESESLQELLVDQLADLLDAEKQLTKALPKMAQAARSAQLRRVIQQHLQETQAQVERLNACFELLGTRVKVKPCKGMKGLIEEGEEVIKESASKDDAAADLALIGAAQRVEHYETAGYITARDLAQQLNHSAVAQHLSLSLGEEENADQLLGQVAKPLMSAAKMPEAVE
jgi:Mn-containing catalase